MRVRRVAGAMAMLAIWAAPAGAQTPSYGGGHVPSTTDSTTRYVPTLGVTLQPRGDRVALRFDTSLRCGGRSYEIVGRTVVPWDGRSFSAAARRTMDIRGGRIDYDWAMSGQADGTIAAGSVRVAGVRVTGGRRVSCDHRPTRPFSARLAAPAPPGAPRPPGGASYGGVSTISVADGLPGPVVLKASRDGGKVAARWTALGPCRTGPRVALVNFTPATPVKADGSFARSERFTVRYDKALVRYRVRFAGRISGESASGTLRLRARIYNLGGTRLRTTCDTRTRTWSAALLKAIATAPAGTPPPSSSTTQQPREPVPGDWSLTMTSDSGDYIGQGHPWSHGPPGDTLHAGGTRQHVGFSITTTDPDNGGRYGWWTTDFAAPPGQDLVAGTTYQATRYPFNDGNAGFDHSGMGRGCNTLTATYTIQELAFDPDGTLRTFRATFEQHCEGGSPALRGTWVFHAA